MGAVKGPEGSGNHKKDHIKEILPGYGDVKKGYYLDKDSLQEYVDANGNPAILLHDNQDQR